MSEPPQYLTAPQVAARWGVSPRTVLRYVERGQLTPRRLPGGAYRIAPDAADVALERQANMARNRFAASAARPQHSSPPPTQLADANGATSGFVPPSTQLTSAST